MTLPPRQWQILHELLYDGADTQTIARRLGISEWTVKTHVQRMLRATDCQSRMALVIAVLSGQIRVVESGEAA